MWLFLLHKNTNIHLDLRQSECYLIRPTVSWNNNNHCRMAKIC